MDRGDDLDTLVLAWSTGALALVTILTLARAAAAQSAEAEALFNDGDKRWGGQARRGVRRVRRSNRIEARAGTLIRLGECREKKAARVGVVRVQGRAHAREGPKKRGVRDRRA